MTRLALVLLVGLVAGMPARAQRAGPAFDLLREVYTVVFEQPAYRLAFETEVAGPDSTTSDTGEATVQVDLDSGLPWLSVTFDEGETRRLAFDGEIYEVDFPRTQTVYVDSTGDELWTGSAWALMMHPAFGVGAHVFVQDATTATMAGMDTSADRPCERADFWMPAEEEGQVGYSLCVDVETAFPLESRLVDPDGTVITVRLTDVEWIDPLPRAAFRLDSADGFERVPYQDETPPLAVGLAAPAFSVEGEAGPLALADYAGQYVLLDFWGTWCAPCVGAIPDLQAKADAYPDLVVLGLAAYETDDMDPAAFVRQRGGTYAVARADDALLDAYQVKAFPTYYLVGPDGRILFAGIPDRDPEAEDALADLLASLFPD